MCVSNQLQSHCSPPIQSHATHVHTLLPRSLTAPLSPPRRTRSPWTLHGGHTSPPVVLLMNTVREVSLSHSGQVSGRESWWSSLCGNLFASRNCFTVDGERTACVLPVKSVTGFFATLCRQDCESRWRHTSIDRYIRIARTVYTSEEQGRELQFAASLHPS